MSYADGKGSLGSAGRPMSTFAADAYASAVPAEKMREVVAMTAQGTSGHIGAATSSTNVDAGYPPPNPGYPPPNNLYGTNAPPQSGYNPYATNSYSTGDFNGEFGGSGSSRKQKEGGNDTWRTMLASMKGDNWKVTVVKATNRETLGPPKGKHVRAIIEGLDMGGGVTDRNSPVGAIFYHMRKRLLEPEWIVVVKALTIYHHIFREGNPKFVEYFAREARQVIDLRNWQSFGAGVPYVTFVRSYSLYLQQWCQMKDSITFPPGKLVQDDINFATETYSKASVTKVVNDLPVLVKTLETMMEIQFDSPIRLTTAGMPAFVMIIKDATYLWVAITQSVLSLVDAFFESDIDMAKKMYVQYQRHLEIMPRVQTFFTLLESLGTNKPLPQVSVITNDLAGTMEEYIENQRKPQQEERAVRYSSDDDRQPAAYYEPPVDYYSQSDPEPEYIPPPPRRAPPPPPSESSEEESSEESEDEPEPEPVPVQAPVTTQQTRAFDPLVDLMGMQQMSMAGHQVAQYQQPMYQQPGFQNTGDARIQSIKAVMQGVSQQRAAGGAVPVNQYMALPASTAVPQNYTNAGGFASGGGLSNVYGQMQAAQMQRDQFVQPQNPQTQRPLQLTQQPYQTQMGVQHVQMYQTVTGQNGSVQLVPVTVQQQGVQSNPQLQQVQPVPQMQQRPYPF